MLWGMDLASVLRTVAARLQVEFEGMRGVEHNLSKGRLREALVMEEVLNRALPDTFGIAHGAEIACSDGTVSGECDLVIYDRSVPPIYKSNTYQVLPIESVLGVIEVKSDLDKKALTDAVMKSHQIRCMERTALFPGDGRQVRRYDRPWALPPVRTYVVAFESIGLGTLARYLREAEEGWPRWECLDAIYVPGKGYLLDAASLGNQRLQLATIAEGDVLMAMVLEFLLYLPRQVTVSFNPIPYLGQVPFGIAERSFGGWNADGSQAGASSG
jgi:hypothetical protein